MAFNFLGTYKEEEIRGLLDFAKRQLDDAEERIQTLQADIQRHGWISYDRDEEGNIESFTITPEEAQLTKYVQSYAFYGGDVRDLHIISRGQWLFRTKGSVDTDPFSEEFQGGKVEGVEYRDNLTSDDTNPAITTDKVKEWMTPAIKRKREEYEYKIKRSVDLVDQHLEEIIDIVKRTRQGDESLEELENQIEFYLDEEDYHSAGEKGYETGLPEGVGGT
jgi:hypothetical protein